MNYKPGVINIYKEKGYTSHDVVAIIRKLTGMKTGHTGTLDPEAEGVLPICLGRATKLAESFAGEDKTYIAEVVLGVTTDTGDMTGAVLTQRDVHVTRDKIDEVIRSFLYENRGDYMQTPPMYSAVKIGGKKLYELARKGQTVERPPKAVRIYDIRCLSDFVENKFSIEVHCSKGTYIRSLAMDIGEALGCGAAMGELVRTKSGRFSIEDANKLANIKAAKADGILEKFITPIEQILPHPTLELKPQGLTPALNGNPLSPELVEGYIEEGGKYWLATEGRLVGLYLVNNKLGKMLLRLEVMM